MTTVTARAERRLAAIFAADVVGYLRLVERTRPARWPRSGTCAAR